MPVGKSFQPGRSSSKVAGKGVTSAKAAALSDEVSASLRDQLLAEVETLRKDDFDAWVLHAWPMANSLRPADGEKRHNQDTPGSRKG
jgi:hypothetical protein